MLTQNTRYSPSTFYQYFYQNETLEIPAGESFVLNKVDEWDPSLLTKIERMRAQPSASVLICEISEIFKNILLTAGKSIERLSCEGTLEMIASTDEPAFMIRSQTHPLKIISKHIDQAYTLQQLFSRMLKINQLNLKLQPNQAVFILEDPTSENYGVLTDPTLNAIAKFKAIASVAVPITHSFKVETEGKLSICAGSSNDKPAICLHGTKEVSLILKIK